jgi:hypothetical protein
MIVMTVRMATLIVSGSFDGVAEVVIEVQVSRCVKSSALLDPLDPSAARGNVRGY